MTALSRYSTGTVSIAANGTVVTGTDTIWSSVNVRPGDVLQIGSLQTLITDVTDATHLVIPNWGGGAQVNVAYTIWQWFPQRVAGADVMAQVSALVAALNTTGFFVFVDVSLDVPDRSLGSDGQYAFQPTTGRMWIKTAGAWAYLGIYKALGKPAPYDSAHVYSMMDVATQGGSSYIWINEVPSSGHAPPDANYWQVLASRGAGYGGTSTTSATITNSAPSGIAFDMGRSDLAYTSGARVRVNNSANAAQWMEGPITYTGNTITLYPDLSNGAGTFASWNFNIAGQPGPTGATGKGYGGTSATSLTIGTGTQNFTSQTGLAYTNGARVRISSNASLLSWMEGVAWYTPSNGAFTLAVDKTSGTGTFADWNINIAGQSGAGDMSSANYGSEYAANYALLRQNISAAASSAMAEVNSVVNGAMHVSQSFPPNQTQVLPNAGNFYPADCFLATYNYAAGGAALVGYNSNGQGSGLIVPPPGFTNCIAIYNSSGMSQALMQNGDYARFYHKVEGYRIARYAFGTSSAKSITISCAIHYNSGAQTFVAKLSNATLDRNWYQEIPVAGTGWQLVSFTIPGDQAGTWLTSNGIGFHFQIFIAGKSTTISPTGSWTASSGIQTANSTNATANGTTAGMTGLVITEGSQKVKTLDELSTLMRHHAADMQLCKRYYEQSYAPEVSPGTANASGAVIKVVPSNSVDVAQDYGSVSFTVTKRAVPTVIVYGFGGTAGAVSNQAGTDYAGTGTAVGISQNSFGARNGNGAAWTTTRNVAIFQWYADARL